MEPHLGNAPSSQPPATLTPAEEAQLLQTVEMFEVIAQSQPDDYQSLLLLKEAYQRLGRTTDILRVGRQLADAYVHTGQIPSAIREYEEIVQRQPDATDVAEIIEELLQRVRTAPKEGRLKASTSDGTQIDIPWGDLGSVDEALIATDKTRIDGSPERRKVLQGDDGLEPFGRFLANNNLFSRSRVQEAIKKVREINANDQGRTIAASLLDYLMKDLDPSQREATIATIIDQTRFPYVPLEYYQVDRQIVRTLPEDITLGRLVVPFDMMGRTLMIALCNPFDGVVKDTAQSLLDHEILWYFASPESIIKTLTDAYRLTDRT
jgi:tetratricopeptide (TPR) repeat protein